MRKLRDGLVEVGLPANDLLKHGNSRVVYGVPLASNFREVLLGLDKNPKYYLSLKKALKQTELLAEFWRKRWLAGRIAREGIIEEVAKHALSYPITHGARVILPAEVETSSLDGRSLGVAVERIALCGPGLRIEIGYDCPALCDGFHEAEGAHRWSTGQGSVPEALLVSFGGVLIEVHLAETEMRYGLVAPAAASTARSSKCSSAKQRAGTQKGHR